ncbi:DUF2860 family protein [Ferrimonas balearica]|uniref:DUF2860 family protein n=1 Tax=Ferrimonas balearica TaxID=44012 RepID=UPI001C990556|nr:DUF2860 family protein [Ferrimonas balearica]MBY5991783.1 DUF2860 domain-containing protein [Ferrimonas balearica]
MKLRTALFSTVLLTSAKVSALPAPMPQESGFSGTVGLTASYIEYSSNLIVGNGLDSLSDNQVDSIWESANRQSTGAFAPYLDLRFTFANSQTQLVFGNLIQDAVRFDLTQRLGVRQAVPGVGTLGASFVFSGLPSEVWADPYRTGAPRQETDRESRGVRLDWERIADSNFSLGYTYRDISIDEEQSGQAMGLSKQDQQLLNRNGRDHRFELKYHQALSQSQYLTPSLIYRLREADGDAMANDRIAMELTYTHLTPRWTYIVNGYAGRVNYHSANPVFGQKTDSTELGIGLNLFRHGLWGYDNLSGLISAAYYQSDSKVAFHDMGFTNFSLGLVYRF